MADKPEGRYGPASEAGYADPGFQKDKKPRYPLKEGGELNESHIRAAWNYINKEKNAGKYSNEHLSAIKSKIVSAWKRVIDKSGPPSAADKPKQEASMTEEEVRAAQEAPVTGADKPKEEGKQDNKVQANAEPNGELKRKVSEMEATIADLTAKLDAERKAKEDMQLKLRASQTELLRSQLVGGVMSAEEFEKDKEALLETPAAAIKLMLRPKPTGFQRMQVAAATQPVVDEELTVD